jgi:hypothetical protein
MTRLGAAPSVSSLIFCLHIKLIETILLLIINNVDSLSYCLIARNVCKLLSSNRDVSHFYAACRIDGLRRGSISEYEILTNN